MVICLLELIKTNETENCFSYDNNPPLHLIHDSLKMFITKHICLEAIPDERMFRTTPRVICKSRQIRTCWGACVCLGGGLTRYRTSEIEKLKNYLFALF